MGTDDAAGERLAPETDHPSSLAERSLCRHTPEVGAVCGKAARTVLCGGRAMKRASLPLPMPFAACMSLRWYEADINPYPLFGRYWEHRALCLIEFSGERHATTDLHRRFIGEIATLVAKVTATGATLV